MSTQAPTHEQSIAHERNPQAESVVGFAVLGCFVAGGIGLFKAMGMQSGIDVLLCLLGSIVAFGTVFYVYFRKS